MLRASTCCAALIAFAGFVGGGLVSTAAAHGGDTTVVHACVKDNGNVRIIGASEDCKAQETAQHWSITGPAGPAGPAGPGGPAGGSALRVVDATGAQVGDVVGIEGFNIWNPIVAIDTEAGLAVVAVGRGGVIPRNFVFWPTADCSGTAYLTIDLTQNPMILRTGSTGGTTIYVEDVSATPGVQPMVSTKNAAGVCVPVPTPIISPPPPTPPSVATIVVTLPFTTPFHVE
jgi:hypothetical protein